MFSIFKRREVALSPAAMQRLLGHAQLRHRLDTIYATCGIPRVEARFERELGRLAAFVAAFMAEAVSISLDKSTSRSEALAVATISIVCADHLSRASGKDFQDIAAEAVMHLPLVDEPTELRELHAKAWATYCALADTSAAPLFGIGQAFANFLTTADQDTLARAEPHAIRLLEMTQLATGKS